MLSRHSCIAILLLTLFVPCSLALALPHSLVQTGTQASDALRAAGVRVYGLTDNYLLVENTPEARQTLTDNALSSNYIELTEGEPLYLAYARAPQGLTRLSSLVPVLLRDGNAALAQLSGKDALRVSQAGFELQRLPEEPHPLYVPQSALPGPQLPLVDSFVQRIVNKVSQDSVQKQIQRLVAFRTRFSPADSCRSAEQYVYQYFQALGLDSVELDSYPEYGDTWRNVVGTLRGSANPSKVVVICGHLDCTSEDPMNLAPGAEDNASGTAIAIEAARVLARERLDITAKFIAFTGEEQGILGSEHYAGELRAQGVDVIGALNFDMIAWAGGSFGCEIFCNQASRPLADLEEQMAATYTSLAHHVTVGSYGSDQLSFHAFGYQGTAGAEYGNFYPYYHTTADTFGYLSMPLAREVARMGIASLAMLGVIPTAPDSFRLFDAGTGGALLATWRANVEPDLAGYKLLWGTAEGVYTDSVILGAQTSYLITGLQNGTRYYATVVARDMSGHESNYAPEQSAVPNVVPNAPTGFAALPFYFGMRLSWLRNSERDLAGYNLYRSTVPGTGYVRLNGLPLTDSVYRDSALLSDTTYYYVVSAVDTNQNESPFATEVHGKPITLDHGVLLVNETRHGNGTPGSPSKAQTDAFYHYCVRGVTYSDWDVTDQGIPGAGDIGPYSTIAWFADDFQEPRIYPAEPGLANYLAHNGRLWLTGWKPVYALMNQVGRYPFSFASGQFPYDCLHILGASESTIQDFIGAAGRNGYPDLLTDSLKMLPTMHGRLPFVDALVPRDAETLFTFISASDDSFQGRPVAVRRLTGTGRMVFFGFPFYYMRDTTARAVALRVLSDLGEVYAVEEAPPEIRPAFALLAPRPNPFAGSARIEYSVPAEGFTDLAVYDAAGQKVRTLVHAALGPGRYSAFWNGTSDSGRPAGNGVYFCRLQAGVSSATRKLELTR